MPLGVILTCQPGSHRRSVEYAQQQTGGIREKATADGSWDYIHKVTPTEPFSGGDALC